MFNTDRVSHRTALVAAIATALLASTGAHAASIHAKQGAQNGGGSGNLCDPGQGQSFQDCTWMGSPTIMKFNFDGDWDVNADEAGPGWDTTPVDGPALVDTDANPNTVTYSLNGFTVVFSNTAAAPKNVSWTYDNSGSLVTYWHIKYGGQDQWIVQGDGTAVSSGEWNNATGIQQSISHITFFDSGKTEVPEPGSLAMLGLGLAGLGAARRRKIG